ncbi:MAG: hypothetical protein OXU51_08480 [Candidatus Poribacteria bacterium]|nr:hypothetical protein [Candidatus Poribacteria bacterium]
MKATVILSLFLLFIAGSSRSNDGSEASDTEKTVWDNFCGTENWRSIPQTQTWFFVSVDGTHIESRTETETPPMGLSLEMLPQPENLTPKKQLNTQGIPLHIVTQYSRFTTVRKVKVRIFFCLT